MKRVTTLALIAVTAFALSAARGGAVPDRPEGIAVDQWVPLSGSLGVVLVPDADEVPGSSNQQKSATPQAGSPDSAEKPVAPIGTRQDLFAPTIPLVRAAVEHADAREPVHGYLMFKQGHVWRRLVVTP